MKCMTDMSRGTVAVILEVLEVIVTYTDEYYCCCNTVTRPCHVPGTGIQQASK